MSVETPEPPPPRVTPVVGANAERLVPYPGLEVRYVAGVAGEVYEFRGVYYCFLEGSWYYARTLAGPWSYVEMKYVPSDLFRVRGHLPPGITRDPAVREPPPVESQ